MGQERLKRLGLDETPEPELRQRLQSMHDEAMARLERSRTDVPPTNPRQLPPADSDPLKQSGPG